MSYTIDHGLIVDTATEPPTCAGYIFNFKGRGGYAPTGKVKVGDQELDQAQVDQHNKLLGEMEMTAAKERGKGMFYFSYKVTPPPKEQHRSYREGKLYSEFKVSNWCGSWKSPHTWATSSFTPGFNCGERWHVYFTGPDGKQWYGINQGDNQVIRARRLKKQPKRA